MSYKILRWDVILKNDIKYPVVYIAPDIKFLEFVRNNGYSIIVTINGTNTVYDCRQIAGEVNQSCAIPNCRPNYFEASGYYMITLNCWWNGYPLPCNLGTLSILSSFLLPEIMIEQTFLIEENNNAHDMVINDRKNIENNDIESIVYKN